MESKKEIELLKEVIKQKNILLMAYRLRSNGKGCEALDKLEVLYKKLGYRME